MFIYILYIHSANESIMNSNVTPCGGTVGDFYSFLFCFILFSYLYFLRFATKNIVLVINQNKISF